MAESLHDRHVRVVEEITGDLKAVGSKLDLLNDMQGVSPEQKEMAESLARTLRSVRGLELGRLRLAFGLDKDIAARNQQLRRSRR